MVEAAPAERRPVGSDARRDAPGQVLHDLPVGPRGAGGIDELAHPLHPALAVREGALLLGEGGRGQDDVGDLGRLVHEDVLHDEEVELAQQFRGVGQVGVAEGRILAHDVHAADVTPARSPRPCRWRATPSADASAAAPGLLETGQIGGRVALVARQRVGHAAGVAGALDVVLPAQRRDAVAGAADLAREQRQVEQRRRVGGAVDVLRNAHAPDQAGARRDRGGRRRGRAARRAGRRGAADPPARPRDPRRASGM